MNFLYKRNTCLLQVFWWNNHLLNFWLIMWLHEKYTFSQFVWYSTKKKNMNQAVYFFFIKWRSETQTRTNDHAFRGHLLYHWSEPVIRRMKKMNCSYRSYCVIISTRIDKYCGDVIMTFATSPYQRCCSILKKWNERSKNIKWELIQNVV